MPCNMAYSSVSVQWVLLFGKVNNHSNPSCIKSPIILYLKFLQTVRHIKREFKTNTRTESAM